MKILAIETSCDETAAAIVEAEKGNATVKILANNIASSLEFHAQTGGIIPEMAARKQIEYIIPIIEKTLQDANVLPKASLLSRHPERSEGSLSDSGQAKMAKKKNSSPKAQNDVLVPDIDAIAVTNGPGLIGSLLIGVETARTLSYVWNKPLIPINHLYGHIYANWLIANGKEPMENSLPTIRHKPSAISFPALALVISGGHTDLVLLKKHGDIQFLGGTRDDAAGECFDKCARLLGFAYPGGPKISQLAKQGNPKAFPFPRPMLGSGNFDFSFSGLKTAFLNETKKHFPILRTSQEKIGWQQIPLVDSLNDKEKQVLYDLCASLEYAIVQVLVKKTILAAQEYNVRSILLGGGVAANQLLRDTMQQYISANEMNTKLFIPPKELCTDNAAMIGAAAFFNYHPIPWQELTANPELYFD